MQETDTLRCAYSNDCNEPLLGLWVYENNSDHENDSLLGKMNIWDETDPTRGDRGGTIPATKPDLPPPSPEHAHHGSGDFSSVHSSQVYTHAMTSNDTNQSADSISWSTLLAGWIQFAQRAVALPKDEQGQRWRDSIAPTIGLHALAMALGEIDKVDPEERPLAMDKSEIGIKAHVAELNEIWRSEPMPNSIIELIDDAKEAWEIAIHEGVAWIVASDRFVSFHPGELGDTLLNAGYIGEVLIASPGIEMFKGAPIAVARNNAGGQPEDDVLRMIQDFLNACDGDLEHPQIIRPICQVYRQFDFLKGGAAKDLVVPVTGDLQAGQPLLIPVVSGGEMCPVPLPPRAGKPMDPVEVVWVETDPDSDPESDG